MKSCYLIILLNILFIKFLFSQSIDDTFKEPLLIRPAKIQCIKVLSDNKILIGGDIAFFNDLPVNDIIRLNPDYSHDKTFNFKGNSSILIKDIEFQSTGNIIVLAQEYESVTGVYGFRFFLFQLDANGEIKNKIDTLKNVNAIAVQNNDKVLVCGGDNRSGYVYRFGSDFSVDNAFNQRVTFNRQVTDIKIRDEKLYISGIFSLVNGIVKNDIVKLNLNGDIDATFDTGSGTDEYIGSLTLQNDGKILLGRSYIHSFNGFLCSGLARLNPDGSVDKGFLPPRLSGMTSDISVKDSTIFFASYINVNTALVPQLIKLKPNGSIDMTFVPFKIDFDPFGFGLGFEKSGIIFSNLSNASSGNGLSKCDSAGTLINTFTPKPGRYGVVSAGDYFNGKLIIAGDFTHVNGTETYNIALINKDGSVDTSFVMSSDYGKVIQLKILNADTCMISTGPAFFKINSKARVLPGFNFKPFKTLYNVGKFIVLENKKIIAGDPNNIYRLNADGTEDTTFDIGTGIEAACTSYDFDIQGDKIIYGSYFTKYNGTNVNRLIRLKTDGSLDPAFDIGTGPDGLVSMIKVLKSGEVLVGGSFKYFNGISIPNGIVRLSENGTINTSFNNNQNTSSFTGAGLPSNTKVEQLDSIIFIRGFNSIKALNINGKSIDNFKVPFSINQIHDIITIKDTSLNERKSLPPAESRSVLFALGNFVRNNAPSFVIKLDIEATALSVSTNILNVAARANSTATFDIAANSSWDISCDQPWLTVDKKSGTGNSTITVTVDRNTSNSTRTAIITISGNGSVSRIITVTQQAGIGDIINPVIQIYPSLVTNKTTISFSFLPLQTSIAVYSQQGKLVFLSKITDTLTEIDMSLYMPGIYLVKVMSGNKIIETGKIVKQNE